MTRVKICGIKDVQTALTASESGADFLGFVLAQSIRQVTPENVRSFRLALNFLKTRPLTVGVFVNAPVRYINHVADYCQLDWVQLSGNESWAYCQEIERPFIKVVHISERRTLSDLLQEIDEGYQTIPGRFICMLDTASPGTHGGTGLTFNWNIAREITLRYPVIVAGGLNSNNVGRLIKRVNPWGVDVSSGVENNGEKDPDKIRAFISAAREAEKETTSNDGFKYHEDQMGRT